MAGQYEDKPNTGVLFVKKIKNSDASPDFDGNFSVKVSDLEVVDGEATFKLSGWKKKSKAGNTYISLAVNFWKPDEESKIKKQEKVAEKIEDDDIPW
tara:strand:+ start:206 stop:496 length:291 start_codon:yes stop_codon:yes gene_type:complete